MIDVTACPTRAERVLTQNADGELVLLHLDKGTYFALNEVGARVWELCDGGRSVASLVGQLVEEFEAPPELIEEDVCALLNEMAADDLVSL